MKPTETRKTIFACTRKFLRMFGVAFSSMALLYAVNGALAQTTQVIRGTVTAVSNGVYTVKPDNGNSVQVQPAPSANIQKLAADSTDLKSATPTTEANIAVGDRVLLSASVPDSGPAIARLIYVMKRSDIQQYNSRDETDWQRRGISGLVRSVNLSARSVTISVVTTSGTNNVTIQLTPRTQLMRYAADSVKFADAKPESLATIQVGDQLQARGDKTSDGNVITADEVVTGSFRNISGLITRINAAASTITVKTLIHKETVTVSITSNTAMHKLTASVAADFAARLKGRQSSSGRSASSELTQLINKMPNISLADLHTGDALMIAATASSTVNSVTAITVLGGVEPILAASSNDNEMTLEPWGLSSGAGSQ